MIALVATIIASTCIFFACSKEEENNAKDGNKEKCMVQNEANPYDFVGKLHNEGLDYIFSKHGTIDLSDEQIHSSLVDFSNERFENFEMISPDEFFEEISDNKSLAFKGLTTDYNPSLFDDELLNSIINEYYQTLRKVLDQDEAISPESFSKMIIDLENKILGTGKYTIPTSLEYEANDYDAVLVSLAIARYSFSYWYEIAFNDDNPFNKMFLDFCVNNTNKDCPAFWKKVKDFCTKAWSAIKSVVCFVAKDAAEFGKLAKGGNATHLRNGIFYFGIGVISIGTSASK